MFSVLQAYFFIKDEVLRNINRLQEDDMEKGQSQEIDPKVSYLQMWSKGHHKNVSRYAIQKTVNEVLLAGTDVYRQPSRCSLTGISRNASQNGWYHKTAFFFSN